ncbi:hypothetical protein [Xanthocytophaga agilis]|uniref:Lipoprotein n=1 Tax=Xanthocytophaga agilis TaxID=3048010 RepID=A0AAE3QY48_9BACT|nr:hypothetical protein [Xanthocytophaga agilis]MDJ1500174.1 hypothetical protein [Xanthocytophaga agilis]
MKGLLLNSIIVLCLIICGCGRHPYKNSIQSSEQSSFTLPDGIVLDTAVFYKTSVHTYGKSLSGILGLRKKNDTLLVTFFSEMGLRFFDISISKDTFEVKDCLPQLRSRAVIQTIVSDLRTAFLWDTDLYTHKTLFYQNKRPIIRFTYKNDWIFAEPGLDNTLTSIAYTYGRKYKLKYTIHYTEYTGIYARQILIKHANFNLEIRLSLFKFT